MRQKETDNIITDEEKVEELQETNLQENATAQQTNKTAGQPKVIDLQVVLKKIWEKKWTFAIILSITFIVSCIYIFSVPRYYTTDVKLAPEIDNMSTSGALSSIASSFGFDLSNVQSTDAITPLLYPDLMEDNGFVSNLFDIPIATQDDSIKTNYFKYLKEHQKHAWWQPTIDGIKNAFKKEEKSYKKANSDFDPYYMSKPQDEVAQAIRSNITISVDKKTGVITISIKDQDPLICKTLGDSLTTLLQKFITEYRTSKARVDEVYYANLARDAKKQYEDVRKKYIVFADANTDVILQSVKAKLEDMENDMQLKYNTYTTIQTQYQAAQAKVRERTPVFTMIKGAEVPVKPTGPKRVIFILGMLFLVFICTAFYVVKKDVHLNF